MSGYQKLVYVPSEGFDKAPIVIVGEAPGEMEEKQRRPFVGRSGQLVRTCLATLGLAPEHYKITNTICVRPRNNRTPTPEEVDSWLPHLKREVENARLIIALGRTAQTALNKAGVENFHCLYHPAYVLRNPSYKDRWQNDFYAAVASISK